MTKKTRKVKQKAGAIPFLPPEIAPTTGGKSKELAEQFFKNNNVYYISGHGALLPNKPYKIPENTYILHAGVSGKVVTSEATGTCSGQNDLKELVQENQFVDFWKLLTNQAGAASVRLYSRTKYEPEKELLSIYAPGDIVSDMVFEFSNLDSVDKDVTACGVYKVPVKDTILEEQEKALLKKSGMALQIKRNGEKNKKSAAQIKKDQEDVIYPFIDTVDTRFRNRSDNLLKDWFNREPSPINKFVTYESNLLNDKTLFPVKAGGIRLFVVWACRAVNAATPALSIEEGQRARARSINLQEYNVGVKEAALMEKVRKQYEGKKLEFTPLGKGLLKKIQINNRKTRRNNAIANADRVILNDNYNVIKNLRNLLPQANKNMLNLFNQRQKNERKAKYDEIFKRLKNRLVAERDEERASELTIDQLVEAEERKEMENYLSKMSGVD